MSSVQTRFKNGRVYTPRTQAKVDAHLPVLYRGAFSQAKGQLRDCNAALVSLPNTELAFIALL